MRTVEVEGNSRVDATRRALELLGADIDDVKVEVLREEPRGVLRFLGFKRVTVRVTLVEENVLEEAAEIINRIVSFLPVPVEAHVRMQKHTLNLELAGRELREFQKTEDVADALGHVLELIINRRAKNKITVKASFAEDKVSREEELRRLARATADRVASSRTHEALPPMSPRDRRTVHMTLERDDRVVTESSGSGSRRFVVVYPAAAKRQQPAPTPAPGPRPPRKAAAPREKAGAPREKAGAPREKAGAPREKAGAPRAKTTRRRRRGRPKGGGPDKKQPPSS